MPPPSPQRPAATVFLQRVPPAPLGAFVATLWTAERPQGLPHAREWNLPTGCADLVLPLHADGLLRWDDAPDAHGRWYAGGVLQGAMERPTLRDTAGASCVVGAHFHPGGLAGLLAMPADELAGRTLALDTLWPGWAARLRGRLLGAGPEQRLGLLADALTERLRHPAPPDPMVARALDALAAGTPVVAVLRASGCAPATFERRFRAACGLTPQRLRVLQRFGRALQIAHDGAHWAEAAAAAGYADQSHLSRDFRRHAGHTPSAWAAARTGWAQHMAWRG